MQGLFFDFKEYLHSELSGKYRKPQLSSVYRHGGFSAKEFKGKFDYSLLIKIEETLKSDELEFIGFNSTLYPQPLKHISDPPLGFFVKGNTSLLQKPMISIVGARNATLESMQMSFDIGKFLSESGYVVVSGGAFGCDIAAHKGVLAGNNPSHCVSVFAGGLQDTYPLHNRSTHLETLEQGGLWVSEKLPWQKSYPYLFPLRNRIIAGFSENIVLVQASLRSGSMITANLAACCGRDVLVFDSPVGSHGGNTKLLLDGALGFESLGDFKKREFTQLQRNRELDWQTSW